MTQRTNLNDKFDEGKWCKVQATTIEYSWWLSNTTVTATSVFIQLFQFIMPYALFEKKCAHLKRKKKIRLNASLYYIHFFSLRHNCIWNVWCKMLSLCHFNRSLSIQFFFSLGSNRPYIMQISAMKRKQKNSPDNFNKR